MLNGFENTLIAFRKLAMSRYMEDTKLPFAKLFVSLIPGPDVGGTTVPGLA